MAHTHHDEHYAGGDAAAGAAAWMMAMFAVIAGVALLVALFVWAPWNDGTVTTNTDNTSEQAPADDGGGVSIEGNDVDINTGGDAPVEGQ